MTRWTSSQPRIPFEVISVPDRSRGFVSTKPTSRYKRKRIVIEQNFGVISLYPYGRTSPYLRMRSVVDVHWLGFGCDIAVTATSPAPDRVVFGRGTSV